MNLFAKGAVFLPAVLAGVAAWATPGAQPAAAPAFTNPFNEQLRRLDPVNKMAAIRRSVTTYGERCGRVTAVNDDGRYNNLGKWSVRCVPGGDYALFIGPDQSVQVRACDQEASLKLPACTLPAEKKTAKPYAKAR